MVPKKYLHTTRFLAASLALLITTQSVACGWGDEYETIRLAFFKAATVGMEKYKPAFYSEHYLNIDSIQSNTDRRRNCADWQRKLGAEVNAEDIYTIQYKTSPEEFKKQYDASQLDAHFNGNSFIRSLLKPQNKALLEYLGFAKEMEYEGGTSATTWESWGDKGPREYWEESDTTSTKGFSRFLPIEKRLATCEDPFLQERYAFMLIRYGDKANVIPLYNHYFENSTTATVLKPWAMLFRAYATKDKAEQNYYLSRCFDLCEEKVIAVLQWYNYDQTEETLKLAKNDHERAVILAIRAMRDPGPVLEKIKEINRLAPGSDYVNLLISREVNKFEDWLFFTQMSKNEPEIYSDLRLKNYRKDIVLLHNFKKYLIAIYAHPQTAGNRDFLAAALAHLSFMDDKINDGYKYASAISANAVPSIVAQKYTELALVAAKQGDINTPAVKQQLYEAIDKVREVMSTDRSYSKSLYTLLKLLATQYNEKGDMATANLLFLKGDNYKYEDYGSNDYSDSGKYNYFYLGYLDQYAKEEDIDHLIALLDKKSRTAFERFICDGTTTTKDAYLNLKGKLAFRKNNFKLAYETFSKIPDAAAHEMAAGVFRDSIDPFFPAVLNYGRGKVKDPKLFSAAAFTKEIINLESKSDAESYLKLGHAFYNTSYMGNAWFMYTYYEGEMYWQVNFGSLKDKKSQYANGNYAKLTLARKYYMKALKAATNDEQRAMASLMLHVCARYIDYGTNWDETPSYMATLWLKDFYGKYNKTQTFKSYSCPGLDMYLK
jgi:hypothetical protein